MKFKNSSFEGLPELNGEFKTLQNEFQEVQRVQQQRIIQNSNLQQHLEITIDNLAIDLESLRNYSNAVQNKQREIISQDMKSLKANLTITTNNFTNILDLFDLKLNSTQEKQLELVSKVTNVTKEFRLIDQQIETVQRKQLELVNLGEEKFTSLSSQIGSQSTITKARPSHFICSVSKILANQMLKAC